VQAAGPVLDLQLEVFVNGAATHLIGAFRQESDGGLSMESQELQEVGLVPMDAARDATGRIRLERLPGVTYHYDEAAQAIRFTAPNEARTPRVLNARPAPDSTPTSQSAYGAVLNYTLFANFQNERFFSIPSYQGVAGTFDGRLFSPTARLPSPSPRARPIRTSYPISCVSIRAGPIRIQARSSPTKPATSSLAASAGPGRCGSADCRSNAISGCGRIS
jgi:hypothetical protein